MGNGTIKRKLQSADRFIFDMKMSNVKSLIDSQWNWKLIFHCWLLRWIIQCGQFQISISNQFGGHRHTKKNWPFVQLQWIFLLLAAFWKRNVVLSSSASEFSVSQWIIGGLVLGLGWVRLGLVFDGWCNGYQFVPLEKPCDFWNIQRSSSHECFLLFASY